MKKFYYITFLCVILTFAFSFGINAQQKTESVNFKIRTSSPGGSFSPKNIGAIWVEDASGNFIKTLQLWADRRIQYLYTWNSISSGNKVDALTSATLSSHQVHDVTWDVKDYLGNAVPDGQYKLRIEITDKHAQGPLASFVFPIGEASNVLALPDETYFHDIELSWNSIVTDVNNKKVLPSSFSLEQNYPNPFNPSTIISYSIPQDGAVTLSVYDILGNEIAQLENSYKSAGTYSYSFKGGSLTSGIYFYTLKSDKFIATKKMLLIK